MTQQNPRAITQMPAGRSKDRQRILLQGGGEGWRGPAERDATQCLRGGRLFACSQMSAGFLPWHTPSRCTGGPERIEDSRTESVYDMTEDWRTRLTSPFPTEGLRAEAIPWRTGCKGTFACSSQSIRDGFLVEDAGIRLVCLNRCRPESNLVQEGVIILDDVGTVERRQDLDFPNALLLLLQVRQAQSARQQKRTQNERGLVAKHPRIPMPVDLKWNLRRQSFQPARPSTANMLSHVPNSCHLRRLISSVL